MVEFFFQNEHIRNDTQNVHLRTFPDLEKLYAKFYRVQAKMRNNAQLVDCVKVYNMIHTLSSLVQYLDENTIDESHALKKDFVVPLRNILEDFNKLKAMLEECIDIGKAKQNDYIINPDFSPELKVLDEQITKVKRAMERLRVQVE